MFPLLLLHNSSNSIIIFCCNNRHIVACLHFNENINRKSQKTKDGQIYMKVTYPKYKLGEELVREVASAPTYGKTKFMCCILLLNVIMQYCQYCIALSMQIFCFKGFYLFFLCTTTQATIQCKNTCCHLFSTKQKLF